MKKSTFVLSIALSTFSGISLAEMPMHEHQMGSRMMSIQTETQSAKHEGVGIIKAVKEKAQKVQIAHEPISSLEWPAMTMWFAVSGSLPKGIKEGDSVKFDLEQNPEKKWSITHIEKQ
jgi:Cu/Ag efflux protein CusF